MSRSIAVSDEARYDIVDISYKIAEDSLDTADRFASTINEVFEQLSEFPSLGVSRNYDNPKLTGMRMWPVPHFEKYLVFYTSTDSDLQIVRVLHGSRDITDLFSSPDAKAEQ